MISGVKLFKVIFIVVSDVADVNDVYLLCVHNCLTITSIIDGVKFPSVN